MPNFGILTLGPKGSSFDLETNLAGLEDLGGPPLLASAAVSAGVWTVPARDELFVSVRVTGYSGADIASFRFNGDTGTNYWSRYHNSLAGQTTYTDNPNVSQTVARCFALTTTLQRTAWVKISNPTTTSKRGVVLGGTSTGAAGTAGQIEVGGFEWVNTTAQITSIELRTAGGTLLLNAGTSFHVWGKNF